MSLVFLIGWWKENLFHLAMRMSDGLKAMALMLRWVWQQRSKVSSRQAIMAHSVEDQGQYQVRMDRWSDLNDSRCKPKPGGQPSWHKSNLQQVEKKKNWSLIIPDKTFLLMFLVIWYVLCNPIYRNCVRSSTYTPKSKIILHRAH